MVYFDAAGGEPLDQAGREAYLAALDEGWAGADRLYREGRRARMLLDAAREAAAEALGCRADELVFTSSGTTAVHQAVLGLARGRIRAGRRILAGAAEHSSVLHAADTAARRTGGQVELIPVDRAGRVRIDALRTLLNSDGDSGVNGAVPDGEVSAEIPDDNNAATGSGLGDTVTRSGIGIAGVGNAGVGNAGAGDTAAGPGVAFAAIQSANHEVGTRQPVAEAARVLADAGVPLLLDAAVTIGREPLPEGWSVLAGSARKWGGPAGVGVLAVRKGTRFAADWPQDERERGWAPGPVDVPAILAAATVLRTRQAEAEAVTARQRALVALLRERIPGLVPDVELVGDPVDRAAHILTFSCLYASGEALLLELDRRGFSVSSGSSCTASTLTPSHVLEAMGVLSQGNVRVSLPWDVAAEDVERFLEVLPEAVRLARPEDYRGAVGTAVVPAGSGSPAPAPGSEPGSEPGPEPEIDALGKLCPLPVIELGKRIAEVPPGATIRVLADDPAARLDIPAWCRMTGHEYLGAEPLTGAGPAAAAYRVRRRG